MVALRHAVFVDTSAWYALTDADDENHPGAVRQSEHLLTQKRRLLTTNHVVSETYTLLRRRLGFSVAQRFVRTTRASTFIVRLFISESWEEAAEDLLVRYEDQDFSYVDATSFIAMQRLGIDEVFAFDHHFSALGFIVLGD